MLKSTGLDRVNSILFFMILIGSILYFGRELFVLLIFSGFLAMLMTPVSNMMENHKFSRIFSTIFSILIIIAVISVVLLILSAQIANISEDFPQIKSKFEGIFKNVQSWIGDQLGISSGQVKEKVSDAMTGKESGGFFAGIVMGTFTFTGSFILVLVFTFLFLFQREKYENFIVMLHKTEKRKEAKETIGRISKVAQSYLTGRIISIFILAVLYAIGFSIIGLKNGLILAAIAAIVSFVPYIGPLIGGLIPFIMALIGGSGNQAIWVLAILTFAQFFDNYFIEPYIVGGSVNISPFFTIFILIVGGAIWGIAGVILFLPLLGVTKIIFENIEGLKPYAYLIGDQKESSSSDKIWLKIKGFFSGKK